jgi:hypothetical protein
MSCRLQLEEAMRPDDVEVSWDKAKSKWLIRIRSGEEVIRRYCDAPKNAGEQTLRSAAQKTVEDEGYEVDPLQINLRR